MGSPQAATRPPHEQAALTRLETRFPGWECWTVRTFDGMRNGVVWCARRRDDHRVVINEASEGELAAAIGSHDWPDT